MLVRKPELLNQIVNKICCKKDSNFKMKNIVHENEEKGYELVLSELKGRMK